MFYSDSARRAARWEREDSLKAPAGARAWLDLIRAEATRRSMTAYELGEAAGVHGSVVVRFLNGTRDVRTQTAQKICDALGLTLMEAAMRSTPKPKQKGTGR
jgi:hypothetical protein